MAVRSRALGLAVVWLLGANAAPATACRPPVPPVLENSSGFVWRQGGQLLACRRDGRATVVNDQADGVHVIRMRGPFVAMGWRGSVEGQPEPVTRVMQVRLCDGRSILDVATRAGGRRVTDLAVNSGGVLVWIASPEGGLPFRRVFSVDRSTGSGVLRDAAVRELEADPQVEPRSLTVRDRVFRWRGGERNRFRAPPWPPYRCP
jgi:hypothetical protein